MKIKELREMATGELMHKEKELREELFRLRIRKGSGQIESPALLKQTRKDIARIKTVLREKGTEGA